jgi:hypothetical protein
VHLKGVEEMTLPDGEPIPFAGWVKEEGWQYLTDAEIKEIVGGYGNEGGIGGYTRELFDKIEAKIREKNE